jgi:hypothetical protein
VVQANKSRSKSLIFVGVARLPRAPSQNELFVVEVEADRTTFAIESVHVNPPFGGLRQLLESALMGQPISRAAKLGQEAIDGAYFSPYRPAVKAALLEVTEAFERFQRSRAFPRLRADWEG